jgi:hypothetical protein
MVALSVTGPGALAQGSDTQTVPQVTPPKITAAHYAEPTARYPHGVLGDDEEWGALRLETTAGPRLFRLPDTLVFEDTAPRLADLDGDGRPEVIVAESHVRRGARLAVWGSEGRITATPHIGQAFRWLAIVGAADLDGDGAVEIALVDRPHLARELVIWRYRDGALSRVARAGGLTNHRIGETDIAGGIRDCAGVPEIITANADWTGIMASRFDGDTVTSRLIGPHRDRADFDREMVCDPS